MQSRGEAEARIGAALLDAADRRKQAMAVLANCYRAAVAELDAKSGDAPAELRSALRSLDGLRAEYEGLLDLEVKAAELILDLRGLMALAARGTPRRPLGYVPLHADLLLGSMAVERKRRLKELLKRERSVQPHVTPKCYKNLKAAT